MENPDAIESSGSVSEEFAVTMARGLHVRYRDCAVIPDATSLILKRDATIAQYQDLIACLVKEDTCIAFVETMVMFMIGDALTQGEDIFGEDYACVFGIQIRWSYQMVNNIMRTARAIPPDLRSPKLSWRFYTDLAGADMTRDALKRYISLALQYKDEHRFGWRKEVLTLVREQKIHELIAARPPHEQEEWRRRYEEEGKPHWRKLKGWMQGTVPLPIEPMTIAGMVISTLERRLPKDRFMQMSHEDVRQACADAMWDGMRAIKRGTCAAGKGEVL